MAFTYCSNCGEKIDITNDKCPYCGHRLGGDYSYGNENSSPNGFDGERGGFSDFDGNGSNFNGNGSNGEAPHNEYYPPRNEYTPPHNEYRPPYGGQGNGQNPMWRTPFDAPRKKRPISVGLVIFSIINIVFSCCTMTSFIFGIIALIYTVKAQNAKSDDEEIAKKKTALIINVAGAVLGILSMTSFFIVFADVIVEMLKGGTL